MKKNFFAKISDIKDIPHERYAEVANYIHAVSAISKFSNGIMGIVDFLSQRFLFVSYDSSYIGNCDIKELIDGDGDLYKLAVPEDEYNLLKELNKVAFDFIYDSPGNERTSYTVIYDLHLMVNGSKRLVSHKLTPLAFDRMGNIWLAVCSMTISHNDRFGNLIVRKSGQSLYWKYDISTREWRIAKKIELSPGEIEVLLLSARGYTIEGIAAKLNRAIDTIKSRRRSIFDKLNVSSISKALTAALNQGLL